MLTSTTYKRVLLGRVLIHNIFTQKHLMFYPAFDLIYPDTFDLIYPDTFDVFP